MSKQELYWEKPQANQSTKWMRLLGTPALVGGILLVALVSFEMFNFDTTRYALASLLGDVRFLSVSWATILAIAFCAIDFAGLVRFFMTDGQTGHSNEYWYLTGAWLLGATMNAIMTWWAVSLTLLNHNLGNEVLSRAQLVEIVPIFVAALVWLTRILFIGAFTVAGGYLFAGLGRQAEKERPLPQQTRPNQRPITQRPRPAATSAAQPRRQPVVQPPLPVIDTVPAFLQAYEGVDEEPLPPQPRPARPSKPSSPASRIQRRPPTPTAVRRAPAPMRASGRKPGGRQ